MTNYILYGVVSATVLMTSWASFAGWGLAQPEKEERSVRQGSTHTARSSRGFVYLGRGHGYYGGK